MDESIPRYVNTALFTAVGLLIAMLAFPLMRRRVKPNWLYGLRVRATFADESVWYDANERSGRTLVALGLATMLFGVGHLLVPESAGEAYFLIGVVALVVGTLLSAIDGWRYANRLLEERRAGSSD
jgi:uncharacterized membrane protein